MQPLFLANLALHLAPQGLGLANAVKVVDAANNAQEPLFRLAAAVPGLAPLALAVNLLFRPANDNASGERETRALRLSENQKYLEELDPESDDLLDRLTNRQMNADEIERVEKEILKDLKDEAKSVAAEADGERKKLQALKKKILETTSSPEDAAKAFDEAEGQARKYVALGNVPQDNAKDAEAVRDELSRLASETYDMLGGAASISPFEAIQKRTNLYAGRSFLARGELETGIDKLKAVRKDFPEVEGEISKYEDDAKRMQTLDAMNVWEGAWKAQIQSEHEWNLNNPFLSGAWLVLRQNFYGNWTGTSDGAPRYRREMEILGEVKKRIVRGESESLNDALKKVSEEGPEYLRSRAGEILSGKKSVMEAIGRHVRSISDDDVVILAATLAGGGMAAELGMMARLNALQNLQRQGVTGTQALLRASVRQVLVEGTVQWSHKTGIEALYGDPTQVFSPAHLAKSYGASLIMVGGQNVIARNVQFIGKNIKSKAALGTLSHASGFGGMVYTDTITETLRLTNAKGSLKDDAIGYAKFAAARKIFRIGTKARLEAPAPAAKKPEAVPASQPFPLTRVLAKKPASAPMPPTEPQASLLPSTPRNLQMPSVFRKIMNRPRTERLPEHSPQARSVLRPGTGEGNHQVRGTQGAVDVYEDTHPGASVKFHGNNELTLTSPGQPSKPVFLLARKANAALPLSKEDATGGSRTLTNLKRATQAFQDEPSIPSGERKGMSELVTSVSGFLEFHTHPYQRRLLQAMGKRTDALGAEARKFSADLATLEKNIDTWSQGAFSKKMNRHEFETRQDRWMKDVMGPLSKLSNSAYDGVFGRAMANRIDRVRGDLRPLNFALSQMEVAGSKAAGNRIRFEIRYEVPKAVSEIPMMEKNPQFSLFQIPTKDFAKIEIGLSRPEQMGQVLRSLKAQGLVDASFTMKSRAGMLPLKVGGRIVEVPIRFEITGDRP